MYTQQLFTYNIGLCKRSHHQNTKRFVPKYSQNNNKKQNQSPHQQPLKNNHSIENIQNSNNHIIRYHDSNSMESQSLSIDRELTGYSTHSYSNSETLTSHSSQNSNPFIPPSPQKIFGSVSPNKTRNSFKHRPNAPIQVYAHLPQRPSTLKKIKQPKIVSPDLSALSKAYTMATNVRLDPLSPSASANEESDIDISTPLDTMDNVFITSPIVTRKRSGNQFTFNREGDDDDAASTDDDNEVAQPPHISISKSHSDDNNDDNDNVGHSDIPLSLPDYFSASEFLLCDPTLDPKRNLKSKLKPNAVKNIRARGATWIGQANNYVKHSNVKSPSSPKTDRLLLSPSITTPAIGTRVDRTDSLNDTFKSAQMIDGHIVLNQKDLINTDSKEIDGREFLRDPLSKFPIFQSLHQRYAQEAAIKVFGGNLKSYQRAFVPINPQDLGLKDFSNMRSRLVIFCNI